jgi:RNA polymerase sigma-70 factor (ECF subfamily)
VTPTDSDLVARARGGSQSACREIVRRHERPIYNLILRMVRDRSTAEDLAQETFMKAFARLGTFDPRYKLSNWLLKIAHNTVIDHLRVRRPATVPLDDLRPGQQHSARDLADDDAVDALRSVERAEIARVLERGLARLRAEYRQVVVLRYHEDLSHEEIAGIMGVPVGTVKSLLHRARAELAGYVRKALPAGAWSG